MKPIILKRWLQQYKKVAGLEVKLLGGDRFSYNLVVLEKQRESLRIVHEQVDFHELEQIPVEILRTVPVALMIDGKGILHRKLPSLPAGPASIIHQLLPNAKAADFVLQTYRGETVNWASLARKETVKQVLFQLDELKCLVIDLALGPFPVRHLLPMMTASAKEVCTNLWKLDFQQGDIIALHANQKVPTATLPIGDETVKGTNIGAFAVSFQALLGLADPIYNADLIEKGRENYRYKRLFMALAKWFLIGTFTLLLANAVIYMYLDKKNQVLGFSLAYHGKQLNQLDSLQSRYEKTKNFLSQNSALQPSKVSFYANEIGRSLPEGIQLVNLVIFPPAGKTDQERKQKEGTFEKTIQAEGKSRKGTDLNNWIKKLEGMAWVTDVKVLPYSENTLGTGHFVIEIDVEP